MSNVPKRGMLAAIDIDREKAEGKDRTLREIGRKKRTEGRLREK